MHIIYLGSVHCNTCMILKSLTTLHSRTSLERPPLGIDHNNMVSPGRWSFKAGFTVYIIHPSEVVLLVTCDSLHLMFCAVSPFSGTADSRGDRCWRGCGMGVAVVFPRSSPGVCPSSGADDRLFAQQHRLQCHTTGYSIQWASTGYPIQN